MALVGGLAFAVARPILRLRGHYLAMATLGLGIIIAIVLNQEVALTGGPDGMPVGRLGVFGLAVRGEWTWYWLVGGALLLTVWLALNLIESPIGRALRALHGSEVAAATAGVDTTRYKVLVFVVSAVLRELRGLAVRPLHRLPDPRRGDLPPLDRVRHHGRAGRHGLDLRRGRRRRDPDRAAAVPDRVPRLRAGGVRRSC